MREKKEKKVENKQLETECTTTFLKKQLELGI
jgi:hypothetical protein